MFNPACTSPHSFSFRSVLHPLPYLTALFGFRMSASASASVSSAPPPPASTPPSSTLGGDHAEEFESRSMASSIASEDEDAPPPPPRVHDGSDDADADGDGDASPPPPPDASPQSSPSSFTLTPSNADPATSSLSARPDQDDASEASSREESLSSRSTAISSTLTPSSSHPSISPPAGGRPSFVTSANDLVVIGNPMSPTSPTSGINGSGSGSEIPSFANALSHHFGIVSDQVEAGSYAAKRCCSFMRKIAQAQEDYARTLQKILLAEQNKVAATKSSGGSSNYSNMGGAGKLLHSSAHNADGMAGTAKSWAIIQDLVGQLIRNQLQEVNDIQSQVVQPLAALHAFSEDRRRAILSAERSATSEMAKSRDEVNKSFTTCQRLLEEARRLQMEGKDDKSSSSSSQAASHDRNASTTSSSSSSSSSSNSTSGAAVAAAAANFFRSGLNSLKKQVGRKPEQVLKEAGKAAAIYSTHVDAANKRQTQYLSKDLPTLFMEMEALEKRRMESCKQKLLRWTNTSLDALDERKEIMGEIKKNIERISAEKDVQDFIVSTVFAHGPSIPPRPFTYEFAASPSQIESGKLEGSEVNPNSVFRTTLKRCMELQSNHADPNVSGLGVPRIFSALLSRFRALHGENETGIFRLSVAKEELDALRSEVDSGNYAAIEQTTNAHLIACLLKDWLRLLEEPLIPTIPYYEQAIECVRQHPGSSSTSTVVDPKPISNVFHSLPQLNQRLLSELASLVRLISAPSNEEKNRMNVTNLSIVFAPSFLRNPSEDPLKLLENSKYETRFTEHLFRVIAEITW